MSSLYPCISDYNYPDSTVVEPNDGTDECDLTGYLDSSTYIAQMLEAGIMLDQVRRGTYDYEGEDDSEDPEIDPLRAPWTDPSDVDAFANGLEQTVANKQAAAARAASNQSSNAKASDHELSYPPSATVNPPPPATESAEKPAKSGTKSSA